MRIAASVLALSGLLLSQPAMATEVNLNESMLASNIFKSMSRYQACGLPMSDLEEIPGKFNAWAAQHTTYGKPIIPQYKATAALDLMAVNRETMRAACQGAKSAAVKQQMMKGLREAFLKLEEAHRGHKGK